MEKSLNTRSMSNEGSLGESLAWLSEEKGSQKSFQKKRRKAFSDCCESSLNPFEVEDIGFLRISIGGAKYEVFLVVYIFFLGVVRPFNSSWGPENLVFCP